MKFQVGKPVTGKNLIGRDKELKEIETYLNMGQSVVLIAPRRYGKTSLMLEIIRRFKRKGDFVLYTDIFSTPDIYNLAADITKGVLQNRKLNFTIHQLKNQIADLMNNIQFRQEIEGSEFILGFGQTSANEWDLLKSSLKMMDRFSEKYQKIWLAYLMNLVILRN